MRLDNVVGTGVSMGFVHVLTGPDHLSALCTLAAATGAWTGFLLGVRWGVGHSLGLIVMTICFLCFDTDLDKAAVYFEPAVGVCMLLLGLWGFWRVCYKPDSLKPHSHGHAHSTAASKSKKLYKRLGESGIELNDAVGQRADTHIHDDINVELDDTARRREDADTCEDISGERSIASSHGDGGRHAAEVQVHTKPDQASNCRVRMMALAVGLVHGVAGPGGILGVIPAIALHQWLQSSLYLVTFCVTSIGAMGGFAALYGHLTQSAVIRSANTSTGAGMDANDSSDTSGTLTATGTLDAPSVRNAPTPRSVRLQRNIMFFSSSLSFVVGIAWLVLLHYGKLEDVFG